MIPELGQFALILAFCLALVQAVLPIAGAAVGKREWMALARPAAAGQFVFVAIAFGVLVYAFLSDDFSVLFVAQHSNTALPTFYKFAATWGGHEGSLLFWITVLAIWTVAVVAGSRSQPQEFSSRVLGVLGIVSAGIMAFALFASNPFTRLSPTPFNGADLNPLLQDPGMVIHPPSLYGGYVGMAVPFAFAVAALLTGRLDKNWARWTRPWTVLAWVWLTCGITLGSGWAYYELGWGGWWAWDPVENSSFMPWLMATALLHSLAVTERRGIFKSWTVLLAIAGFSLSLLGTFLTRSPVLVSVHAFASDPARGMFILGLLGFFSGGGLLLYALRASKLEAEGGFKLLSRETFLLANNILLVIAALVVLWGTLTPVFVDALAHKKVSVGTPWFDLYFLLPTLPLALFLGAGMHSTWKITAGAPLVQRLMWPAALAVAAGIAIPVMLFDKTSLLTIVAAAIGLWVCATALLEPVSRLVRRHAAPLTRAQLGMYLAHLGVGVFILGVTFVSAYTVEKDVALRPGDRAEIGGYEVLLRDVRPVTGPNYTAQEGEFELRRNGRLVTVMKSQQRLYPVQQTELTEAAIDTRIGRDVIIALSKDLGAGAWAVRIHVKPGIRFLWLGSLLMALGGLLAVTDRRYRQPVRASSVVEATAKPAATGT
ncbi:MAG TPA: heme lyase CcmF/NrfE family subunit [Gammaproteobacteria bacterium]|nr:heme lyase CcmF/NrfE family subunit [Gammaproteobacteria bacterium]